MKNIVLLTLCSLTFMACSTDDDPVPAELYNPSAMIVYCQASSDTPLKTVTYKCAGDKLLTETTIQNGELKTAKRNYTVELITENNKFDNEFKNGKIYLFKTGMIAVKPGNSTETETNGFLILNQNKTELKLFHKWGE